MPTFNVLRINEKHLAKVRAVRSEGVIKEFTSLNLNNFIEWHKGISKQLSNSKALTSCTIQRIYE